MRMRIGVNLGACGDWQAIVSATQRADQLGFDAVSFLDHYHAEKPEWPYMCGWSVYGALAMVTSHIRLVPMVIDRLNYLPGVLAKETAMMSILSNGRFELGIGAGDYFQEMHAWGLSVPPVEERVETLKETIQVLKRIWRNELVTFEGKYLHLKDAVVTPNSPVPPRIVVGVGSSRRLIRSAVEYADELNVYAQDDVIQYAHQAILTSGRTVALSVYVWDWLDDFRDQLSIWEQMGVERAFITFSHPFDKLEQAVKWFS